MCFDIWAQFTGSQRIYRSSAGVARGAGRGPRLLQGCSLCGSVKPVTPSLTPHSSVLSVTVNRPLLPGHTRHFGGKIFGAKTSKLLPVEPRQFPSLPSVRAPHKELRVLLVRELSEARDSESAADIYNLRPVWPRNIKTIRWREFKQLDILQ